jgi:hypothetical protein
VVPENLKLHAMTHVVVDGARYTQPIDARRGRMTSRIRRLNFAISAEEGPAAHISIAMLATTALFGLAQNASAADVGPDFILAATLAGPGRSR